ncbi:MAG: class I SAM-dependent methyltransferase [Burkholderiales bacterium]
MSAGSAIPLWARALLALADASPRFKRLAWRTWYQYLAGYPLRDWRFMNYGYAALHADEAPVALQPEDEADRSAIHLYDRIARAAGLSGREVLEVGCGRGGGCWFVMRYHHPRKMTGVDFSPKAVRLCRERYDLDGLEFAHGDAEALPFADESFDAVINVESSHCYGSMPAFLREVRRVLRRGGDFLFGDLRAAAERGALEAALARTGMALCETQDITANVVAALRLDSARKMALIERAAGARLAQTFREFAAVEGSEVFAGFESGATVYLRYALRK